MVPDTILAFILPARITRTDRSHQSIGFTVSIGNSEGHFGFDQALLRAPIIRKRTLIKGNQKLYPHDGGASLIRLCTIGNCLDWLNLKRKVEQALEFFAFLNHEFIVFFGDPGDAESIAIFTALLNHGKDFHEISS